MMLGTVSRRVLAGFLSLVTIHCLAEEKPAYDMPEFFYELDDSIVTPHIPWAKPYYRGERLRVLVLAPRWVQRDTVELQQRMDAECAAVFFYQPGFMWLEGTDWGLEKAGGNRKEGFLKRIDKALRRQYDVVVVSAMDTGRAPQDVLDRLLAKVKAGAGLVYLHGDRPKGNADFVKWYREAYSDAFVETLQQSPLFKCDRPEKAPSVGAGATVAVEPGDEKEPDPLDDLLEGRGTLPAPKQYLAAGFPFGRLSAFGVTPDNLVDGVDRLVRLYRVGKGNVLFLRNWGNSVKYGERGECQYLGGNLVAASGEDLPYEHYISFLIKCVLWAAKRSPGVRFAEVPERADGEAISFKLTRGAAPLPPGLTVTMSARSAREMLRKPEQPLLRNGVERTASLLEPVYTETKEVPPFEKELSVSFRLPSLPRAEYFLDFQLRSGGRPVNWAAAIRHVQQGLRLSGLAAEPKVIDLRQGDTQELSVKARLSAEAVDGDEILLTLFDNYDRILAEQRVNPSPGKRETTATLAVHHVLDLKSSLLRLRAELVRAGKTADVRVAHLTTINRPFPFFTLSAWGGAGRDRNSRHRFRLVADLGFDIMRGGGSIGTLRVADTRFDGGFLTLNRHTSRDVALEYGDPAWRRRVRQTIAKATRSARTFDYFSFIFGGDEPDFPMAFAGPFYAYRAFLRNTYADVEALNKSWGTDYDCFEAVKPEMYTAEGWRALRSEAIRTGRFAPLVDYRMWQYWMVADLFRLVSGTLREHLPQGRLAVTTLMWNHGFRGYFFPEILKYVDFFSPYAPGDMTTSEAGRSFMRDGTLFGHLSGSYYSIMIGPEGTYLAAPHANLLGNGRNYYWYNFGSGGETGLSPCMTPYPQTTLAVRELNWMQEGAAELVLKSERRHPEVAVFYSQESYVFAYNGYGGSRVQWRQNKVLYNLKSMGFGTRFVTEEVLCNGGLAGCQALYLPVSQCLSEEAAARIKDFVREGGLLVADVRPGIADRHGNVYERPPLAEVFGVRWEHPLSLMQHVSFSPGKGDSSAPGYRIEGEFNGVRFADPSVEYRGVGHYDPNLRLDGGTAAVFRGRFVKPEFAAAFRASVEETRAALAKAKTPAEKAGLGKKLEALEDNLRHLEHILEHPDSAPLMVYHRYGKGHAALLGASICNGHADVYLFDAIFRACGVRPMVEFAEGEDGYVPNGFCNGFECGAFEGGTNRYYGYVCKRSEGDRKFRIRTRLEKARHLYDMRRGRYLGLKNEVADEFAGCWAAWYAALPYRVQELRVELDRTPAQRGEPITGTVSCVTDTGAAGRHVINLKVLQGRGEIKYLMQNIEAPEGKCRFRIPTAANDQVKNWGLTFTDVATGTKESVRVKVGEQ